MKKDEFYYPSKDGNTEIHTIEWKPEGEVKAVVQLCHGMVEYIDRYDDFAKFLCEKGIYVVGNDHLGHGKSIQSKSEYGYFSDRYGNTCLIGDMHMLRQRTSQKYSDVPYFLLGHSMGSALSRQYMQLYGNGLQGVILLGVTADHTNGTLRLGRGLCRFLALLRGWHYRSKLVDKMAIGAYNKKFKPAKTRADWVTSDMRKLEEYVKDPLCSFTFTVNAYYNMMLGMQKIKRKEAIFMIPKNLPVLMAAGSDDPVGDFGKGVRKVFEKYKRAGLRDVTLQLYPGDRHELINETDRDRVYEDLYHWIEERMSS
ncbi:MAG: alpha/beta hydrolase [Hespellia sp.]|nr:alpha/beta hydrolase [Hespellia sp.]